MLPEPDRCDGHELFGSNFGAALDQFKYRFGQGNLGSASLHEQEVLR
jgi:hypothetical protein